MTRTAALLLLRLLGGAVHFRTGLLRLGAGATRIAVGDDDQRRLALAQAGQDPRLDLGVDGRDRLADDSGRRRPHEVDGELRVELGVVAAVVAAAGLPPLQGALQGRPGGEDGRPVQNHDR